MILDQGRRAGVGVAAGPSPLTQLGSECACALPGKAAPGELVGEAAFRNFLPEPGGREFLGVSLLLEFICKALYLKERGSSRVLCSPVFTSSAFPPSPTWATVSGRDSWTFIPLRASTQPLKASQGRNCV